jgi:periplasmic divalent cation tolerance protein
MDIIAVLTTTDTAECAAAIAEALVKRRLAACVQISEIDSVYSWQGAIQNDREYRVMAKTLASRYADIETAIRELHSYDLPAIYAIELTEVFAPYADWVAENSAAVKE